MERQHGSFDPLAQLGDALTADDAWKWSLEQESTEESDPISDFLRFESASFAEDPSASPMQKDARFQDAEDSALRRETETTGSACSRKRATRSSPTASRSS